MKKKKIKITQNKKTMLERRWQYLVKLEMGVTYDLAILHLGIHTQTTVHEKVSKIIFTTAIFIIAKICKTM